MRGMPCQVGDQRLELVAVDVTAGEQQALPLPLESALRQQCLQYPLLAGSGRRSLAEQAWSLAWQSLRARNRVSGSAACIRLIGAFLFAYVISLDCLIGYMNCLEDVGTQEKPAAWRIRAFHHVVTSPLGECYEFTSARKAISISCSGKASADTPMRLLAT